MQSVSNYPVMSFEPEKASISFNIFYYFIVKICILFKKEKTNLSERGMLHYPQ